MVPLTLVAGEKLVEASECCTPEGLWNATFAKLTPARLSVADTLTTTLAGPDAVSMVVGVKLNAVRAGGGDILELGGGIRKECLEESRDEYECHLGREGRTP